MRYICTLITVEDIEKSREFYENVLGQKIKFDFGSNIQFECGLSIHLKSHFNSLQGLESFQMQPGSKNIELYFEEDDILQVERKLEAMGVLFVHKTFEQPWKQQVFRVLDPDGYIIEIGESMETLVKRLKSEGLNIQEISKSAGLPEDFIKNALEAL